MKLNFTKRIQAILVVMFCLISINTVYGQYSDDTFYYTILSRDINTVAVSGLKSEVTSTSVTVPSKIQLFGKEFTVVRVMHYAFQQCTQLKSITLPNTVTIIGGGAFDGCTNLETINIPESVVFIENKAFETTKWFQKKPDGLVYINKVLYTYKNKKKMPANTSITVKPGTVSISPYAFDSSLELAQIILPNTIDKINYGSFYYCPKLTSIDIPNSVVEIDGNAFTDCMKLTTVNIPESLERVEVDAFKNTPWFTQKPKGLLYIGKAFYAFTGDMPENTAVELKEGTKSITAGAFDGRTQLKSIKLPASCDYIGFRAFAGCSNLDSINFPEGIEKIEDYTFLECKSLKNILLPESLKRLGTNAFEKCTGLKSLYIPAHLTDMDYGTFLGCTNIKEIHVAAVNPPAVYENTFEGVDGTINVYVPLGSADGYKNNYYWKNKFTNFVEKDFSGIGEIKSDKVAVYAANGAIVIDGDGRAEVYSISGQCVYSGNDRNISVAPGLYIVKVAGKTVKIGL